jgi:hypothetical protein
MDTGSKKVVTKEQASFTELLEHQEAIILDLETLHYYSLNAAAAFLWQQLRAGAARTSAELSAALAATFSINAERAELQTHAFLDELAGYGLITYTELGAEEAAPRAAAAAGAPPLPYQPPQVKLSNSLLQITFSGTATVAGGAVGPEI